MAGVSYGSALQRQASETRVEGQAQAEIVRATAGREASDLQSRAHKLLGLQAAAASRSQALGSIAGGYAMSVRMNEAQRQATTGLLEQSRQQQVVGILADRSFGQRQAGIQTSREERELRLGQAQQNAGTIIHRSFDVTEHTVGSLARLGGASMPLLPAAAEITKSVTSGARGAADLSLNDTATAGRIGSAEIAGQSQIENIESTSRMREYAADRYAQQGTSIANQQAAANNAAARVQRDLATGGVERAYAQQVHGVTQAYQLQLDANQLNLRGALQAAEVLRTAGFKAARAEQMSNIITTLSSDLARRSEQALTLRY